MAGKEGMPYRVGVDKWLFFTTMLLVVAGLVMVFSASAVVAQERYHSALCISWQAGNMGGSRNGRPVGPHAH